MQNKDLSRFFPDNPLSKKAFQFVRYDENGKIIGCGGGTVPIGTLKLDHIPTDSELNAYVETKTGREVQEDDTVIVVVNDGNKVTTYNYYYTSTGWDNYELTGVDLADNGVAGIVEGNYSQDATADLLLDIVDGVVKNIYIKSGSSYRNLVEYINANRTDISGIVDGTVRVGEALKALEDGNGNNIANTYLDKTSGATKEYVQDYAISKIFNDILYLSSNGFTYTLPTTPSSGVQFHVTSSSIGETTIFDTSYTLLGEKLQISKKNSLSAQFYILGSGPLTSVQFKLSIYAKKVGQTAILLSQQTLDSQELPTRTAVEFSHNFDSLNDQILDLSSGDEIKVILSVITTEADSTGFNVYCNSTYPSGINLNLTSIVQDIQKSDNGVFGTIEGTYNTGSTNNVLADIQQGELKELYFKDNNTVGGYRTSGNLISTIHTLVESMNGLGKTGSITLDSGNDSWDINVGSFMNDKDSIMLSPFSVADREEGNRINLIAYPIVISTQVSPGVYRYTIYFTSDIVSNSNITLYYTVVKGNRDNQFGVTHLIGIMGSQVIPPVANQVTDEFGNPVTDENNNPVVIV